MRETNSAHNLRAVKRAKLIIIQVAERAHSTQSLEISALLTTTTTSATIREAIEGDQLLTAQIAGLRRVMNRSPIRRRTRSTNALRKKATRSSTKKKRR